MHQALYFLAWFMLYVYLFRLAIFGTKCMIILYSALAFVQSMQDWFIQLSGVKVEHSDIVSVLQAFLNNVDLFPPAPHFQAGLLSDVPGPSS